MLIQCFNESIGAISELTGARYEPEKGIRSHNIKAAFFNLATISLITGIAVAIFSNPIAGLAVCALSLAAKIFVQIAMNETFLGKFHKENGNFFYKHFLR